LATRATLSRHPLAVAGALLTTVSAVVFIALVLAVVFGLFQHPYAGLVVFVVVPGLLVLGLLLIPLGMWLEARRLQHHPEAPREWPVFDLRRPTTRRTILAVIALTAVNIVIVSLAAKGAMHWMESPSFCGQACHLPMQPQFTAWQAAPHSEVTCTQCHVGEGAKALVRAKLAGTRQLYHVLTNQIPKPIPGVADMRPALETCGRCHWPGRDSGDVIKIKREYADDDANSETMTILQMFVGGPGRPTSSGRAIHWHADPNVRIEFVATDHERQKIPYVRLVGKDGTVREYKAEGATDEEIAKGERRVMDCIDCHNVPAHRIAPTAEQAVDAAIANGSISRDLPSVRRESVRLVKSDYSTQEQGLDAIEKGVRGLYTGKSGVDDATLAQTIAAVKNVYRRNVFPAMKVTFGVYPDNLGHITSNGCARCHDGRAASDGRKISDDCEFCHKQIERPTPGRP
jgi:nitrate/TMAO reductase-like tetraheme cytochrome c subunit